MFKIKLDLPPSANARITIMRGARKVTNTSTYRAWQLKAVHMIKRQLPAGHVPWNGSISFTMLHIPADRRARDLDNMCKAVQDALTRAGLIEDDRHISRLRVYRLPVDKVNGGHIVVYVQKHVNITLPLFCQENDNDPYSI